MSLNPVTRQTLIHCGIDPKKNGLDRFIPEAGISPLEFIRLPIEQNLSESRGFPAIIERLFILTRPGILSRETLEEIADHCANVLLREYESRRPRDKYLRDMVGVKKQYRQKKINHNNLKKGRAATQALEREIWHDPGDTRDRRLWKITKAIWEYMQPGPHESTWGIIREAPDPFHADFYEFVCETIERRSDPS